MQSHEMSVPGMLPMCIRVLLHLNTEKGQRDIHHVYLREASRLRPDLVPATFHRALANFRWLSHTWSRITR